MALKNLFNRKILINTLIVLIVTVVFIHLGVFIFLNVKGKDILKDTIKKNFGVEAQVEALSFRFPFTVVIKNLKCADISFKEAQISLGFFNPWGPYLSLNKVYVDTFNFKIIREKDKIFVPPVFTKETIAAQKQEADRAAVSSAGSPGAATGKKKELSFEIGKLYLKDGSGELLDLTQGTPVTYAIRNISLELKHFVYPQLPKFYVRFAASLEKGDIKMNDVVNIRGWADYAHKNMDIDVNINNVEYLAFSEYYPFFWKPENLGVKEAALSLASKFNSKDNDLVIEGVLSLDKIEYPEPIENSPNAKMLRTMIAFFKAGDEKAALPIRLRTKMDAFKLDFSSIQYDFKDKIKIGPIVFIQNAIDKTKEVLSEQAKKASGKAKDAKDITFEKAVDILGSVVGSVQDIIKRPKEDKSQSNMTEGGAAGETANQAQEVLPLENLQLNINEPSTGDISTQGDIQAEEGEQVQNSEQTQSTTQTEGNTQAQSVEQKQANTSPAQAVPLEGNVTLQQ